ncbi:MAG: hypothetical protein KAU90_08190 [Sulfurovaceae bacterium]|nr:hypothetical protein [Sulfurovaceae bacterium]
MRKYLVIALGFGFTLLAINAFINAKPISKAPIYKSIKKYSPYYLEKRFGGLEIKSKTNPNFKEKPNNMEVFHHMEFLEKEWGQKHLKIVSNMLIVSDDNGTELIKLPISTKIDSNFIHKYYGI